MIKHLDVYWCATNEKTTYEPCDCGDAKQIGWVELIVPEDEPEQ